MEKVRNNAIDIFRYVCAILVISIHSEPFLEINSSLHYFFVQVVPRIAVPFFFTIAGYYYIKSMLGTCVDIYNNEVANGTNIISYTCKNANNQKWKLEKVS